MSTKPVKVMHFVHWSRSGITSLVNSISKIDKKSFDVCLILLLNDDNFAKSFGQIDEKIALNFDKGFINSIFKCIAYYRKLSPDIVHIHSITPLIISSLLFFRSKLIFHSHNYYNYFYSNNIRSIVKRNVMFILLRMRKINILTVNVEIETYFLKKGISKVKFINNGVPDSGTVRKPFSIVSHAGKFYTVSRLSSDKNLKFAIDIMSTLRIRGFNVSLDIFGSGKEDSFLKSVVKLNQLTNIVKFKGYIENPEMLPCDYDFYLSTATVEGVGLSMIDALRGMIPVIMTPVGGLVDELVDMKSVIMIDFNIGSSVDKVESFLSTSDKAMDMIQYCGREVFEKAYHIDKFVEELETVYTQALMSERS